MREPCHAAHYPRCRQDLVAVAYERYHHPEPIVATQDGCSLAQTARLGPSTRSPAWPAFPGLPLPAISKSSPKAARMPSAASPGKDAVVNSTTAGSALEEHFRQHPPRSLRQAQQTIEQRTGLHRGLTQVRRFLRRSWGSSRTKVAAVPLPPKSTLPEHVREQRRFLDDELEPQLREARAGLRDVYFVDASHFVFGSFLGYVWCFVRLCIRAASGRKRYQRAGAVHAISHQLIRVVNHSYINATYRCATSAARSLRPSGCGASDHAGAGQCPLPEMRW